MEWGKVFLEGGEYVEGLTFNDVAVQATDFDGFKGSVPAEIEAGDGYAHSCTFDISGLDAKTFSRPDRMRVIAVLTDGKSGKVVNCVSSAYMDGTPFVDMSGVEETTAASEAVETGCFTLDGRQVGLHPDAAAPGIYIVRYSDGTVKKVLVK